MTNATLLRSMLIVVAAMLSTDAAANPTGGIVVQGTVTIQQTGLLLQVNNNPNSIINWASFSIAANEITRFNQQSPSSAVLNRVVGSGGAIDPSLILGALQSNGRVFLVNPSGILFGAGSQVDVAGLVATSLNLSDADFLSGRLRFSAQPGAGSVINQGQITTMAGGGVYLVGPAVTNSGIIISPAGEVILAAGNSVELLDPATPNLRVEISAPDNEAVNLGQIVASSGRIGIYAGLVKTSGTLNADRAVGGPAGEILLKSSQSVLVDEGGLISASGGTVAIEGGQIAIDGGNINATGAINIGATENVSIVNSTVNTTGMTTAGAINIGATDNITIANSTVNTAGNSGAITVCLTSSQACGNSPPIQGSVVIVDRNNPPFGSNAGSSPGLATAIRASDFLNAQIVETLSSAFRIGGNVPFPGNLPLSGLTGPQGTVTFEITPKRK